MSCSQIILNSQFSISPGFAILSFSPEKWWVDLILLETRSTEKPETSVDTETLSTETETKTLSTETPESPVDNETLEKVQRKVKQAGTIL